jgi:hypothetical protein
MSDGTSVTMRMDSGIVTRGGIGTRMDSGGRAWMFGGTPLDLPPYMEGALPGWRELSAPSEKAMPVFPNDGIHPTGTVVGPVAPPSFPDRGWDPFILAGTIATDFARAADWTKLDPGAPPSDITSDQTGLDAHQTWFGGLSSSAKAEFVAELDAQRFGTEAYFSKLLACSREFRPVTHLFVILGIQLGGMVSAQFKIQYKRPRPGEALPNLRPLLPTPRHPAYPSGHAMQSYLIAAMIGGAVPKLVPGLNRLAHRMAINRERAGVHYPSDTVASLGTVPKILAEAAKMDGTKTQWNFADLQAQLKAEWP